MILVLFEVFLKDRQLTWQINFDNHATVATIFLSEIFCYNV